MFTVHLKYGFSSINTIGLTADGPIFGPPGYEVNLLYIAGLISLMLGGAGALSIDRLLSCKGALPEGAAKELHPTAWPVLLGRSSRRGMTAIRRWFGRSQGRSSPSRPDRFRWVVASQRHSFLSSSRTTGGYPMRAILRTGFGGPEVLVIREIPEPEPRD